MALQVKCRGSALLGRGHGCLVLARQLGLIGGRGAGKVSNNLQAIGADGRPFRPEHRVHGNAKRDEEDSKVRKRA